MRSASIESLFGRPVVAAELVGDGGDPERLFPEERQGQERWVPKRVAEYAAGRQCAHLALRELGVAVAPILAQGDRRPVWPAGVVGSITHCTGYCGVVVSRTDVHRSVGVDAEVAGALDEKLWERILTAPEREWVDARPQHERRLWATVVFSAKEAFYKCQYPVTGHWLEFRDAHSRIDAADIPGADFSFVVESKGVRLAGRGTVRNGIVCTAMAWPAE